MLAHSLGEGREGVGHDCQAALLVNLGDRDLQALVALQPGLQEQAQEMAAASRDLLADYHVNVAAAL